MNKNTVLTSKLSPKLTPRHGQKVGLLGVVGLLAPPERGGLGLTEVDLVLLIEECGRAAVPEPVVEAVAVLASGRCR